MTPEQKAAYVIAMAACANAEVAAMQASNIFAFRLGRDPAYDEQAFRMVIDNYGISHNAVVELFRAP